MENDELKAETNNLIFMFVQDIKNYQKLGGDINKLNAKNVYKLLNNEKGDFEYFDEEAFKKTLMERKNINYLNELYNDAKTKIETYVFLYVFRKMKIKEANFEKLSLNNKIIYLTHLYRLISYK